MSKNASPVTHLSDEMNQLKIKIQEDTFEQKKLLDQIHKKSTYTYSIITGINHAFTMLSSILVANQRIPIIGGIFQLLGVVSRSIATITDPEASIGNKLLQGAFISILVISSVVAVMAGPIGAAAIGMAVAFGLTVVEGVRLYRQMAEKNQNSLAYEKKKEFNALIAEQITPEGNKFNEQFAIRAIELSQQIKTANPDNGEKELLEKELEFINDIIRKKAIQLDNEKLALKLQELYIQREQLVTQLVEEIALFKAKPKKDTNTEIENNIQSLQEKIAQLDTEIINITAPIAELKLANWATNTALSQSLTTFILAGGGFALSAVGLLLVAGVLAAPPIVIPITLGFGAIFATLGLVNWASEKIIEQKNNAFTEKKTTQHKEAILEDALNRYERQPKAVNESSYGRSMRELCSPGAPESKPELSTPELEQESKSEQVINTDSKLIIEDTEHRDNQSFRP